MHADDEKRLWNLLGQIRDQVQQLADKEAIAAHVGGYAATGVLQPSKDALIKRSEEILEILATIHSQRNKS